MTETVARKQQPKDAANASAAPLAGPGQDLTTEELEALEDLEDVRIYQERKHDPRQPFEDFLREAGLEDLLDGERQANHRHV